MANPDHVDIVRKGSGYIATWRMENPEATLDLSGADLSNANLVKANLTDANLTNAILKGAQLPSAQLRNARLDYTDLTGAKLNGANLDKATLTGAVLNSANLTAANLTRTNLVSANLSGAALRDANLANANLTKADLETANLTNAELCHADLNETNLLDADLSNAEMRGVRNAHRALNLETTTGKAPKYFKDCEREWPESLLDWEIIRTVGRLPLFAASYAALILIPVFFYVVAIYNSLAEPLSAAAMAAAENPDWPFEHLAQFFAEKLGTIEPPSQMFWMLVRRPV